MPRNKLTSLDLLLKFSTVLRKSRKIPFTDTNPTVWWSTPTVPDYQKTEKEGLGMSTSFRPGWATYQGGKGRGRLGVFRVGECLLVN